MTDGPEPFRGVDPFELARREKAAAQLKRFYKAVDVAEQDDGFVPRLDGRPLRTPARRTVRLPTRAAAEMLAAEWESQGEVLSPGAMPVTRLINSSLDGVAAEMPAVRAEIVKFAGSDLLAYRARDPAALVERQAREWDPVLAWCRETLGASFVLAEGIKFVRQPEAALAAFEAAVIAMVGTGEAGALRLAALHVMTTLTGSAVLGLAVLSGALGPEVAWRKAHLDEDFQIERWGEDAEAQERRGRRWAEMKVAAALVATLGP